MGRPLALILFVLTVLSTEILAQRSIQAFPMESGIVIDGVHEADKWAGADSATTFVQMAPFPGDTSSQTSIVFIGFDSAYIYISATLYQETEVLAKAMNRDVLSKGDDGFALVIDPDIIKIPWLLILPDSKRPAHRLCVVE